MPDRGQIASLWDSTSGFGVPAPVSGSPPPFHPLTIASYLLPEAGRAMFVAVVAALLATVIAYSFLRRRNVAADVARCSAIFIGAIAFTDARLALFALASTSVFLATDWFAASPTRTRWLLTVASTVIALLGVRSVDLASFAAMALVAAITAGSGARAGAISAMVTAALLAMPWILPGFAFEAAELPSSRQYEHDWPLALGAALTLFVALRRDRAAAAQHVMIAVAAAFTVIGIFAGSAGTAILSAIAFAVAIGRHAIRQAMVLAVPVAVVAIALSLLVLRPAPCAVRTERGLRILDATASSFDCVSSRVANLLNRARAGERWDVSSPTLDVAGIDMIDGAKNAGVLPDFYLAPRFRVSTGVPPHLQDIRLDRVLVDHVPVKVKRLAAPHLDDVRVRGDIVASGGSLVVERRGGGFARVRIRSNGWNLVATNEPAWSGWRAYWNDERLPPVVVNTAFVGSFVPPGDGILTIRYRPDAFDNGLRVAIAGLLLLIVTSLKPWYRSVPSIVWKRPQVRFPRLPKFHYVPQAWHGRAVGVLLLIAYFALLCVKFTAVAGGADSSGYLNQSKLWDRGHLIVPIEFPQQVGLPPELSNAFIPLGFVHGPRQYTMVPSYPPGLPLMISAVRAIAGEAAAFRVVALLAALGVLLMYALGRTLDLPPLWAAAGAAIVAVFPTYLFMSVQPMTDSIATAFAVAAMICAFRGHDRMLWAAASGALFGAGVMVRPTQFLLFPAILLALRLRPRALIALGLGGLPFAIAQGAISDHLYGSPLATGYGGLDYLMSVDGFVIRFKHYVYWLAVLGTPLLFPGGLGVAFSRSVDRWGRATLVVWFAAFFIFYTFYPPYETWWYTRFLLPALPSLIVGMLLVLRQAKSRIVPLLVVAVIAVGAIHTLRFNVFDFKNHDAVYIEAVVGAQRHLPAGAILVTGQLSGAVRYYSGREIVRWDGLDEEKYTLLRRAAGARPWFALVADFETEDAMRRAPGRWVPLARYRSVVLFRILN